jgi:hypothetical protein
MNNANREKMKDFISQASPNGLGNYEAGFKAAYDIYRATEALNQNRLDCQTIFLFFLMQFPIQES